MHAFVIKSAFNNKKLILKTFFEIQGKIKNSALL